MSRRISFFRIQGCSNQNVIDFFALPDQSAANVSAFLTATGLSYADYIQAVCNFVTQGLDEGWYTPLRAVYILSGGNASAMKYNLRNPADTDAAFRLAFTGGNVFTATGWTPNGINGYGNTFYIPGLHTGIDDISIHFYSRTNNTFAGYDMGSQPDPSTAASIAIKRFANASRSLANDVTSDSVNVPNTTGLFTVTRLSSVRRLFLRNGVILLDSSVPSTALITTQPIYIGGLNNSGNLLLPSNRECAFAAIGGTLTALQTQNLYNGVQTLQTIFNRAV